VRQHDVHTHTHTYTYIEFVPSSTTTHNCSAQQTSYMAHPSKWRQFACIDMCVNMMYIHTLTHTHTSNSYPHQQRRIIVQRNKILRLVPQNGVKVLFRAIHIAVTSLNGRLFHFRWLTNVLFALFCFQLFFPCLIWVNILVICVCVCVLACVCMRPCILRPVLLPALRPMSHLGRHSRNLYVCVSVQMCVCVCV
jgi:hypothetical protein